MFLGEESELESSALEWDLDEELDYDFLVFESDLVCLGSVFFMMDFYKY